MNRYLIGLDYGTLSARALLVDADAGRIMASAESVYPHGVITEHLPEGWALQHPQDYLDALYVVIPEVMKTAGIRAQEVAGIGLDATACTAFPVDCRGTPLCFQAEWKHEPNAFAKLWKHHAAQGRADRITAVARERKEPWLSLYGGKVSGEWGLPKLWELLDEAPGLYQAMHSWIEAGDWLVWQLTGQETRNLCAAGFKHFHVQGKGYPDASFYAAVDPRLERLIPEKYTAPVIVPGQKAGGLTAEMADRLGLCPGIPVSAAGVDAHAALPAAGICKPGEMLAIIGTSTCVMTLAQEARPVPGICGMAKDAILPGFYAFEAGQSCTGDLLGWFCGHCVPGEYQEEARRNHLTVHQLLTGLAERLQPGETGLLALDWWNGNRSILVDFDLNGLLLGMTLQTRPEDIYRALIESTAFGLRVIADHLRQCGVPVGKLLATGGISRKNALMMQIYADVLNLPIHVIGTDQGAALGSAIYAAGAAGIYADLPGAVRAMAAPVRQFYMPVPAHAAVYDQLFREYRTLHDLFAGNGVMKRLRQIRNDACRKPGSR